MVLKSPCLLAAAEFGTRAWNSQKYVSILLERARNLPLTVGGLLWKSPELHLEICTADPCSDLAGLKETGPRAFSPGRASSAFTQGDRQLGANGRAHSLPVIQPAPTHLADEQTEALRGQEGLTSSASNSQRKQATSSRARLPVFHQ